MKTLGYGDRDFELYLTFFDLNVIILVISNVLTDEA